MLCSRTIASSAKHSLVYVRGIKSAPGGTAMQKAPTHSGWCYVSNGQRSGPVNDQEIQRLLVNGTLGSNSLVWKQGMGSWQRVHQVQALAHLLASIPPELPPQPPRPSEWRSLFLSLRGRISRKSFWIGILPLWALIYVPIFLMSVTHPPSQPAAQLGPLWLTTLTVLILLWFALLLFGDIPIGVKRLHDLDMSGWWIVFKFIPLSPHFPDEPLSCCRS